MASKKWRNPKPMTRRRLRVARADAYPPEVPATPARDGDQSVHERIRASDHKIEAILRRLRGEGSAGP